MNATLKAPAGGIVSQVNGQFYNGGEFIPDTGLFCGKKGAKRRDKVEKATARGRYFDLGGNRLFEVRRYAGNGTWDILGIVLADGHRDAEVHAKARFGVGSYDAVEIQEMEGAER